MRALLALCVLVLAGCATTDGHGGHDGAMEVVLGVQNIGAEPAAFTLTVQGPVGSGPMEHRVGVKVNETVERHFTLTNEGLHRATVKWALGSVSETWLTEDCRSVHVVFHVDPARTGEITPDRTRECH